MSELLSLTARQILAAYADGSLSPRDYMQAVIDRVEAVEPKVAALWLYRPEEALAEAEAASERWAKGAPKGPLDGLPVTIKEMIATKGDPVPNGTAASDLTPAEDDAPAAARLREDGAIFFAKTTAPDFGMLSSGLSSFHKLSRNPWDLSQNPGGSSAGAGSAGAAGFGPVHMGTDIGGSIRIPAGWCGLFGFKPTQGRVPVYPHFPGRCHGPMTRCVDDALVVMPSLARPDWRDATSVPPETLDWNVPPTDVRGKKLGLLLDAGCGLPVDKDVRDAIVAAADRFAAEGAEIVEIGPFMTQELLESLVSFWQARFWAKISDMTPERRTRILPFILEWAAGGKDLGGAEVAVAFEKTIAIRDARRARASRVRRDPLAGQPDVELSRGTGDAQQRSAPRNGAHRLHHAVEHGRPAGVLDPLRNDLYGHSNRFADRGQPVRRPWRPGSGTRLRGLDRRDHGLAGALIMAAPACATAFMRASVLAQVAPPQIAQVLADGSRRRHGMRRHMAGEGIGFPFGQRTGHVDRPHRTAVAAENGHTDRDLSEQDLFACHRIALTANRFENLPDGIRICQGTRRHRAKLRARQNIIDLVRRQGRHDRPSSGGRMQGHRLSDKRRHQDFPLAEQAARIDQTQVVPQAEIDALAHRAPQLQKHRGGAHDHRIEPLEVSRMVEDADARDISGVGRIAVEISQFTQRVDNPLHGAAPHAGKPRQFAQRQRVLGHVKGRQDIESTGHGVDEKGMIPVHAVASRASVDVRFALAAHRHGRLTSCWLSLPRPFVPAALSLRGKAIDESGEASLT